MTYPRVLGMPSTDSGAEGYLSTLKGASVEIGDYAAAVEPRPYYSFRKSVSHTSS